MKLIAISAVKYGAPDKSGNAATAQPGEPFEVDTDIGKRLIEGGSAATPADYARAKAASRPDRERIAELEAQNAELAAATAQLTEDLEQAKADLEAATKKK